MSTKALKKELLVAVVMLLVAAVALSGSTYAWFAKTTVVEANTLDIVVETASTLAIANEADKADASKYGTVANLTSTISNANSNAVAPLTITDASAANSLSGSSSGTLTSKAIEFYQITSSNTVRRVENHAADVTMAQAITSSAVATYFAKEANATAASPNANFLYDTAYLAYFADTTKMADVQVRITLTDKDGNALSNSDSTSKINKALHIGLVWANPNNGKPEANKISYLNFDTNGADVALTDMFRIVGIDASDMTKATQVDIYAWYEGEDTDCFTVNALKPDEIKIALTFEATELQ